MRTEYGNVEGNLIPVIEFVRPNGEKRFREVECNDEATLKRAQEIIEAGFNFNLEFIFMSYSMCISDANYDLECQIVSSDGNNALFAMINKYTVEQLNKLVEMHKEQESE